MAIRPYNKNYMKRLLVGFLFFSLLFPLALSQSSKGYNINMTIPELKDSTLYLAYHYGDKQYICDTLVLDKTGKGSFTGTEPLKQGIYLIVLPGMTYFEVIMSDQQNFSISCSYPNYTSSLKFVSSPENDEFLKYQQTWNKLQKEANDIASRLQANQSNSDSATIISNLLANKEEDMKSYLKKVVADNEPNLLSALVKSVIPIEIPDIKLPLGTINPDSVRWYYRYNYNKDHFFDNIDLTDDRLLRTPILHNKLESFFSNIVIQSSDSINKEIDKLIAKCESNHDVFQYVSVYLFNRYRESNIMGHDAVIFKIAEDIYLSGKADWITDEFREDLSRQVELLRYNLIGLQAKDLVMDSYNGTYVSLYDIDKAFVILYFWEPSCSHCKEATPKLAEYYKKAKDQGVEVFAVCTTDEKDAWSKFIQDNNLTWINGWDPERLTHFDYYYNVQSTPMIYILDKNKKIIAKKLSVEDIEQYIDNYRKYYY